MMREEYRVYTKIQSVDEARRLLVTTKRLFIAMLVMMLLPGILYITVLANIEGVPWVAIIAPVQYGLWFYLIYHAAQVIKRTRPFTKAWAGWALILAPVSWIWLYPELTDPLKVIIGIKEVPADLEVPKIVSEKELREQEVRIRRGAWRSMGVVMLIASVAVVLLAILFIMVAPQ